MTNIASYIDHTILKPVTTHIEIAKICEEAMQYGFAAVCVPPPFVKTAGKLLAGDSGNARSGITRSGTDDSGVAGSGRYAVGPEHAATGHFVKVATVIGFPFGYSAAKAKQAEVLQAIADGADELDVVINLIALKRQDWEYLEWEMQGVTDLVHAGKKAVKVIIESGMLSDQEIIRCCEIYGRIGVDFVKTSTGYAEKGASIGAVRLMRQHLPGSVHIKASGGIRQYDFARQLVEAGADRLGCSASVEIVKGEKAVKENVKE